MYTGWQRRKAWHAYTCILRALSSLAGCLAWHVRVQNGEAEENGIDVANVDSMYEDLLDRLEAVDQAVPAAAAAHAHKNLGKVCADSLGKGQAGRYLVCCHGRCACIVSALVHMLSTCSICGPGQGLSAEE